MKTILKTLTAFAFLFSMMNFLLAQAPNDSIKIKVLENKVSSLEKRLNNLERLFYQNLAQQKGLDTINQKLKEKAKERMKKDSDKYSAEQIKEAEELYQKGSDKINTADGKKYFDTLISKYPDMNRAGCAFLYLAQNEKGKEQELLLKQSYEKYGDCMYLDGVEVGAYARFHLAAYYSQSKQNDKYKEVASYLHHNYPNAIDHQGKKLIDYPWKD